jgi:hypothetical protein
MPRSEEEIARELLSTNLAVEFAEEKKLRAQVEALFPTFATWAAAREQLKCGHCGVQMHNFQEVDDGAHCSKCGICGKLTHFRIKEE